METDSMCYLHNDALQTCGLCTPI
uniref:Uncharacterized protein n=1 Tax=Anguilla anguilla TaxID=7936 RepID=A0A0E9XTG9_ANGAN